MRGLRFIETISQDVRYALPGFRRTPGFVLTVVATIALGLGLNTALFTIFNALRAETPEGQPSFGAFTARLREVWRDPQC
jgi:hypothetical protein